MSLLPTIEIETAPNPTAAVIVIHGLGADGNDFVPIAKELELGDVGPVRFVFPSAPSMPVTINGGYPMPAWYDIFAPDLVRREDETGLRRSRDAIEALIAREKTRGIPAERIVLAGFSQGCAMALMTCRWPPRPRPSAPRRTSRRRCSWRTARRTAWWYCRAPPTPAPRWKGSATPWNGTTTRWRIRSAWRKSPTSAPSCGACWADRRETRGSFPAPAAVCRKCYLPAPPKDGQPTRT
jgi:pimeloyl-ACP methyl ester carboxylesterase